MSTSGVRVLEVLNALSGADWIALTDALHASKTIESVSFANGVMSLESAQLLSKVLATSKSLSKLVLRKTGQTAESVKALMECESQFVQLCAVNEAIDAALEGVPPIASPCGLNFLDLGENSFGDDGVLAMAPLLKRTHIATLLLDSVGLTTEGFKRLFAEMPKGIQGTTIRSQKVITKIPFVLETLSLASNAPGLDGIKSLADFLSLNTTITSLSLKNCQLGDTSVAILAKALGSTSLSRLSHLELADNQIGAEGSSALISLLTTNHLLVHVNLSNNPIPEEKQKELDTLTTYNQRLIAARQIAPWRSEASISILNDDGTPVGVTCSTVLSNGLVFIGSSYGDVYVWNPTADDGSASKAGIPSMRASLLASDPSFMKQGKVETKIVTYEPESRPTKRRINALIDNHDGTIWCVSDERSITIISIQDRSVQKRLPLHKYQAIAIAKNGLDIFLGGATGEVSLWRSDSLACRHEIVLDGRYPISAIHSDGDLIFVGVLVHPSRAGHILVFTQSMELIVHFEAHSDFVSSIQTFREGDGAVKTQSSSSSSSSASVPSSTPTVEEETSFNVITSGWDNLVKIWKFDKTQNTVTLIQTLDGHHNRVTSLVQTNGMAISCSDDNTLIVWDLQKKPVEIKKRMLGAWGGSIYSLMTAHDKLVSCSHKEGRVTLWSLY